MRDEYQRGAWEARQDRVAGARGAVSRNGRRSDVSATRAPSKAGQAVELAWGVAGRVVRGRFGRRASGDAAAA